MKKIFVYREKDNVIYFLKEIDKQELLANLQRFCELKNYNGVFSFDMAIEGWELNGDISSQNLSLPIYASFYDSESTSHKTQEVLIRHWKEEPRVELFMYGSRTGDTHIVITELVKFLQSIYKSVAFEQIEGVLWFNEELQTLYPYAVE